MPFEKLCPALQGPDFVDRSSRRNVDCNGRLGVADPALGLRFFLLRQKNLRSGIAECDPKHVGKDGRGRTSAEQAGKAGAIVDPGELATSVLRGEPSPKPARAQ